MVLFQSCASIVIQSKYNLTINTQPAEAKIVIKNKHGMDIFQGTSPASVRLSASSGYFSKAEYFVHLSKPGYEPVIVPVFSSIDGWYFGNLLIGGVIGGLIIDPITGAMWKLDTTYITQFLHESSNSSIDGSTQRVIDIANVPDSLKDKLIPIQSK